MRIHQLVHTLSYGDAISGEVFAFQRALRKEGHKSEIYAIHEHPKLKGQSKPYKRLSEDGADKVLLHYSLGSPLNELYRNLKAEKWLIHHNVTPVKWYEHVNPIVAKNIHTGMDELPGLLAISDKIIACSEFNAGELEALGFPAEVLNLPVDPVRWEEESNPGIAAQVQADDSLHVVHVGRMAPNKCIEDVIKAFYFLNEKLEVKSKLWLVGIEIDTEIYSFGLRRLVNFLGLRDKVKFVGCFADSELRALYENASVYLCMSEHEGFCMPVVEAMHFGLPVIAYSACAIPDTIGDGGVLIQDKDPLKVASLIAEIDQNTAMRNKLIAAGKKRVKEMSLENFENNLKQILA